MADTGPAADVVDAQAVAEADDPFAAPAIEPAAIDHAAFDTLAAAAASLAAAEAAPAASAAAPSASAVSSAAIAPAAGSVGPKKSRLPLLGAMPAGKQQAAAANDAARYLTRLEQRLAKAVRGEGSVTERLRREQNADALAHDLQAAAALDAAIAKANNPYRRAAAEGADGSAGSGSGAGGAAAADDDDAAFGAIRDRRDSWPLGGLSDAPDSVDAEGLERILALDSSDPHADGAAQIEGHAAPAPAAAATTTASPSSADAVDAKAAPAAQAAAAVAHAELSDGTQFAPPPRHNELAKAKLYLTPAAASASSASSAAAPASAAGVVAAAPTAHGADSKDAKDEDDGAGAPAADIAFAAFEDEDDGDDETGAAPPRPLKGGSATLNATTTAPTAATASAAAIAVPAASSAAASPAAPEDGDAAFASLGMRDGNGGDGGGDDTDEAPLGLLTPSVAPAVHLSVNAPPSDGRHLHAPDDHERRDSLISRSDQRRRSSTPSTNPAQHHHYCCEPCGHAILKHCGCALMVCRRCITPRSACVPCCCCGGGRSRPPCTIL